jgi:hypothetical protein
MIWQDCVVQETSYQFSIDQFLLRSDFVSIFISLIVINIFFYLQIRVNQVMEVKNQMMKLDIIKVTN